MNLPTEKDIGAALHYLAETDEQFAREVARIKALEHEVKTIKGMAYLAAEGTVGDRDATSVTDPTYVAWTEKYENAYADMEIRRAKRKRAELTIEVWRSLNANRRTGNV